MPWMLWRSTELKENGSEIKAATVCDGVNGSLWSRAESPLSHCAILYPGTACLILWGGTDVGLFDEPNQTLCDEERVFLVALVDSDIGRPLSFASSDRVVCKCSGVCVSVQHGEIERERERERSIVKESTETLEAHTNRCGGGRTREWTLVANISRNPDWWQNVEWWVTS